MEQNQKLKPRTDRIPLIFQKIHNMLLKRADLEGRIDRNSLFKCIAERIGHLESKEKDVLVYELQAWGIIIDSSRYSFTICKEINYDYSFLPNQQA